jgi:hypothetical protein
MPKANPNAQLMLKPQDVVVLLRLSLNDANTLTTYAGLASELKLTASEIHAGVERLVAARLVYKNEVGKPQAVKQALALFVQHGVPYCFPATHGAMSRGMPTSYAAEPLRSLIVQPSEPPPVWPDKAGTVRGLVFHPLYPTVPQAAAQNSKLYELLALVDAVRGGSLRERALALNALREIWQIPNGAA